jgi:hypothetical protein
MANQHDGLGGNTQFNVVSQSCICFRTGYTIRFGIYLPSAVMLEKVAYGAGS